MEKSLENASYTGKALLEFSRQLPASQLQPILSDAELAELRAFDATQASWNAIRDAMLD